MLPLKLRGRLSLLSAKNIASPLSAAFEKLSEKIFLQSYLQEHAFCQAFALFIAVWKAYLTWLITTKILIC